MLTAFKEKKSTGFSVEKLPLENRRAQIKLYPVKKFIPVDIVHFTTDISHKNHQHKISTAPTMCIRSSNNIR